MSKPTGVSIGNSESLMRLVAKIADICLEYGETISDVESLFDYMFPNARLVIIKKTGIVNNHLLQKYHAVFQNAEDAMQFKLTYM